MQSAIQRPDLHRREAWLHGVAADPAGAAPRAPTYIPSVARSVPGREGGVQWPVPALHAKPDIARGSHPKADDLFSWFDPRIRDQPGGPSSGPVVAVTPSTLRCRRWAGPQSASGDLSPAAAARLLRFPIPPPSDTQRDHGQHPSDAEAVESRWTAVPCR